MVRDRRTAKDDLQEVNASGETTAARLRRRVSQSSPTLWALYEEGKVYQHHVDFACRLAPEHQAICALEVADLSRPELHQVARVVRANPGTEPLEAIALGRVELAAAAFRKRADSLRVVAQQQSSRSASAMSYARHRAHQIVREVFGDASAI